MWNNEPYSTRKHSFKGITFSGFTSFVPVCIAVQSEGEVNTLYERKINCGRGVLRHAAAISSLDSWCRVIEAGCLSHRVLQHLSFVPGAGKSRQDASPTGCCHTLFCSRSYLWSLHRLLPHSSFVLCLCGRGILPRVLPDVVVTSILGIWCRGIAAGCRSHRP